MTVHSISIENGLYGAIEPSQRAPEIRMYGAIRRTGWSRAVAAVGAAVLLLAVVVVGKLGLGGSASLARRTVLDTPVDDPLADLDSSTYKWKGGHADGYDPVKQNVLKDDDAFDPPFAGYAKKDLKWKAPSEPEENVLDYLPSGDLTEPKSMEMHALMGPGPPPPNAWDNLPLDY